MSASSTVDQASELEKMTPAQLKRAVASAVQNLSGKSQVYLIKLARQLADAEFRASQPMTPA